MLLGLSRVPPHERGEERMTSQKRLRGRLPEEFETAALFVRSGLPSTLIRHENGAFRKRSTNRRNLKTPTLRARGNQNHFENSISKMMALPQSRDFPDRIFSTTNPKSSVIVVIPPAKCGRKIFDAFSE